VLKQSIPGLGLSLEQGTTSVPNDGQFHVILDTEIVFSSTSESRALSQYRLYRDRLLQERGRLAPGPQVDPE
jgi:hypothetical protein